MERVHYRNNGDAATVRENDGKLNGSAVTNPFHVLWRWESASRGDSVAITGHGDMSRAGSFDTYAVSFNGHVTSRHTTRTDAEAAASSLRSDLVDGDFEGLDYGEKVSVCKHLPTEENVAQMSHGELNEVFEDAEFSKFPAYEDVEKEE